jgi:hypothetical protein
MSYNVLALKIEAQGLDRHVASIQQSDTSLLPAAERLKEAIKIIESFERFE